VSSGGILTGEMRLPGLAVDELLDELAALSRTDSTGRH
jgi:hypothetical protein